MFKIVVDSACNLTEDLIKKYDIEVISFKCTIDGEEYVCYEEGRDDQADGKWFYDKIRQGADVRTSLLSPGEIVDKLSVYLEDGFDVLFTCMSSGLTGTFQSSLVAKDMLEDEYPDRKIIMVDSLSASFGEGMICMEVSKMRENGATIEEAAQWVIDNRLRIRHIFTVDDLQYLRKGGRISQAENVIGSILNIKPLLFANDEGKIEKLGTIRGRKKSLDALVNDYVKYAYEPEKQTIAIAHCDCKEGALYIADKINELRPPKELIIRVYDRCSGTHVGPGALCIFFMGKDRGYED